MNNDNINELERLGYKYIIGTRIKTKFNDIKEWILRLPQIALWDI